tara:strand:- start:2160 stop:2834 length:675 start_codon:yes stop_codon:yes gene_type:complete
LIDYNFSGLESKLHYKFNDLNLLKHALTHRSASPEHNERFEFLGDSILSFVISTALFTKFPERPEGELSRLRAYLVKGDMLAEVARELNLGQHLILGQGEMKSGGHRRASILADALEAIVAAAFLDGGIESTQKIILRLFESRLESNHLNENLKDPKTRLQEHLQAHKYPLPTYHLLKQEGEEHDQTFTVQCDIPSMNQSAKGKGPTRRKAEQRAARVILERLL